MLTSLIGVAGKKIEVYSRAKQELFEEKVYGEELMRVFYGNPTGTAFTSKFLVNKWLSNVYGAYNDSGASKHKIEDFVKSLSIPLEECEKDLADYQSFNEFFARKLKPEARPIDSNPNSFVSPGDGRLLVFQSIDDETVSHVKWAPIRLMDLFNKSAALTERYKGGSCGVLRLCPTDYHRFHFPIAGKAGVTKTVPGFLHSVSPYALEQKIPVFCLNKRTLCTIETEQFGKVLLMEVGALFVGSIVQTYRTGTSVKKGEEKGFFKFGGSTTLFFLERGKIKFDEDLVRNSDRCVETLVKMGEAIGTLQA